VPTKRSEDDEYLPSQSGGAMNLQRMIHTRSRRDKKVDTNMFESLMEYAKFK
jgi:hypothetical protein